MLDYYQERFRYIMVDEYQDTNTAQFELIRLLAGKYQNLCVVGDDDQSIYKFRGANIYNILNFEKHFPDAKTIKLEQNYRSTQNILNAANSVIANNVGRKSKTLWTANDEGKKIWSYTKNNIKSEKAAKVKEEQEKRDQKITELREKAEATKEQISSRLKELNEALTQNASDRKKSIDTDKDSDLEEIEKESSSEKERIDNKKDAEIERLMAIEIPSGLSKAERSKRVAERTAKIAKLRNDAKSDKAKISSDAKTDKASVRTDATNQKAKVSSDTKEEKAENQANAKSERAKVSSELKAAVKSVREAYKAAKADLDSSYEQTYQNEFDKIQSEYKKVKKSSKKSSSSSKKTSHPLSYYIRK